jgi:hypothetical protein
VVSDSVSAAEGSLLDRYIVRTGAGTVFAVKI